MKSVVFVLAIALALAVCMGQNMPRIEGERICSEANLQFTIEPRDNCLCLSDGKHFSCPAIPRDPPAKPGEAISGTTTCQPGMMFKMEARECHCASDMRHYMC